MAEVIRTNNKVDSKFRLRSDLHIVRKLWHMLTGTIGIIIFYATGEKIENFATVLLILAALVFAIEILRLRHPGLNQHILFLMKPFMRESEKHSISGMPFYALGVALSLFFFSEKIAILSVLFLILADPIASFFGILFRVDKILPNKSLQGTLAAFTVCYLTTLVFGLIHLGSSMNLLIFAIVSGFIGALSELCSIYIDDNLCIPVLSGLGLTILNYFIPMF